MGNQDFNAKVRELMKQARALPPAARRVVLELLDEARKRILADLAGVNPSSFQAAQLRQLKASIDAAFAQFRGQATAAINQLQSRGFDLGVGMVEQPLASAGIPTPALGGLSRTTLGIAQGYTADLIQGLSADAAAKVNGAIQRAFLGGQPMTEIVEQIGQALAGDKGFTGIFSQVGERAVMVAETEILRVHSIAGQARLEETREHIPELKKQWRWVPAARAPRITHQMASGQVREVNEAFEVGGEELMYPRDPAGSPGNTINCHCVLVPYFDAADLKPTSGQEKTLRDLGLQITLARHAA